MMRWGLFDSHASRYACVAASAAARSPNVSGGAAGPAIRIITTSDAIVMHPIIATVLLRVP
jgi:hypothetical protein